MKNFLFLVLALGLSLSATGQKSTPETAFFKNLSGQPSVDPAVRKAALSISRNPIILDSLIYNTPLLEKAVLSGKSGGAVKPELVKTALKKYPGTDIKAVRNRLKYYATEGSKTR